MRKRSIDRLACLLLMGALGLQAQIRSGTITGSVQDPSGAVIVDAKITVTNTGTNANYTSKTTETGNFTVPYLEAGTYSISVIKSGFESYRETGIRLEPSQSARVDAHLRLGSTGTAVEVSAAAAQVQTDSSTISGATNAKVIESIPNITQNPIYYAILQNGVQPRNATADTTSLNSFGIGVNGRRQYSAIGVNGGRAFTNDIQLDGLPVMGGGYNEAAVIPNTEGLQEVRVISNNFTAEYGHGQSVIAMSTKSGTNQFHGQGSYLLRNEALNANTNANNANGLARRAFKVNEFGAAISGPIIKNQLFFFSSYHFLMFNQGVNYLYTVPTALERAGDFSRTFIQGANGAPVPAQIFNPYSVTQLGTDLFRRAPYPNAIISNANPYALYMYSLYPLPNRTPDDVYNTNNFTASQVNTVRRHTLSNRMDYKRGAHSIYGSGGLDFGDIQQPRAFGSANFNDAPALIQDRNPYGQIGDTIILSPTLFVDVRYGVNRIKTINFAGNKSGFTDYDKFGVPKSTQALMAIYGAAPAVLPNGFGGGTGGGSNWVALSDGQFATKQENQTGHSLAGSITKVRGKWTHKAGMEARVLLSNYKDLEEPSVEIPSCCANIGGNYTFEYVTANGGVASQNTSNAQRGINGAALLVGQNVWWIRPGANVTPAFAQKYLALYSQNDWKVTPRLTLNLGLRWDLQPGPTERYNRASAYDFTQKNSFGTLGAIAFPGTNGYSRNLWDTQYTNFGPRLGAAYQISRSFVARGGFGITYLPSNTGYFSGPNDYGSTAFAPGTNMLPYGTSPAGVPVRTLSDPAPIVAAVGANPAAAQIYGASEAKFDRHLLNGQVKQANFFLEKSVGASGQWLVSVGYSGSYSTNLSNRNYPFQSLQNISGSTQSSWLGQYIASNGTLNPANVQVQNPWQPTTGPLVPFTGTLAGRTIPQFVSLLPYPLLYGTGAGINASTGYASYNSFQARMSHSFSGGLHVDLNYTWSKELDYTSTATEDGQGFNSGGSVSNPDLLNPANNRKYGFSDQPHRLVAVFVYDSPFGQGKRFAIGNRVARSVLSGWTTGGVITLQSGMPFTMLGASDGAAVARPDRVQGVSLTVPQESQRWYDGRTSVTLPCGKTVTPPRNTFLKYNACAFQGEVVRTPNGSIVPNQYWVGNSAQTIGDMRGPGRFNIDFSLRRSFSVMERLKLEISADASNILNHTQYSTNYNSTLGSTNLVNNPGAGLVVGTGTSSTFGTLPVTAFDPRQITLHARVIF